MEIFSFSATTFSQSSSRPTMMVQTGPMLAISLPSLSLRFRPRSTASATAIHWGNVKANRGVDADAAISCFLNRGDSGAVTGIFTIIFGASLLNSSAWRTMASVSRKKRGSV